MSTVIGEILDSTELLPEALTLVDLLRLRARDQPGHLAYTFLDDGETEEVNLTYGELDRQARAIAASLQPLVSAGDRVLLLYPPGLEYVAAFFGCLYAGAVAVPAYPPRRNRNLLRLQSLVSDAQAAVALTTGPVLARMAPLFSENPYLAPLRWLTSDSIAAGTEEHWQEPIITGADLAFLQYTSGSTSLPKGVMLSHGNLLHNECVIQQAFGQTENSVILGWLPLYHDMGLIGNVIQPMFVGARCVLMSPAAFLQKPFRWLEAISRYRATTSGGPNFAYDLCARKVTAEQRAALDLSSWRVAFNGSEPIRAETIENFAETFAACGFRREAFYPCYGLAEATLIVSGRLTEGSPVVKTFDAGALENNLVVEAESDAAGARTLVGSGVTLPEQETVIVHPQTLERCGPGQVGELWVSSPSVARGYWNRPEQTEQTFAARIAPTGDGPYLRTGDLGFMADGELFVTGRLKDLIIIRGLNHYPQDIELTAERAHEALRPGCGAAFSVEAEGEERLVLVQEVDHRRQAEAEAVCEAVVAAVAEAHEVQVHAVVLIRPGTLPKTSSGKIQRHACRAAFLESSLDVIGQWQAGVASRNEVAEAAPPATPAAQSAESVEGWLRSLLAARLGVDPSRVDVNQSVARYGVDSLAAIELAHAVETSLGVELPVATFLQSPSLAEIAAGVAEQLAAPERAAARTLAPKTASEHPLSHGQKALWFLHEMAPESAAYNIVGAVRILSELDVAALRRAFQSLVNRHAALRTTFHAVEGQPVQRVHDDATLSFEEADATPDDEATLRARLVETGERPFDLENGPVLRVSLFRRPGGEHVLLLAVHHIVADFWSLAVLTHELGALYEGELRGTPAQLAPLALQYADVARWQEEALQSAEGEQHWAYWREQLAVEPAALNLPTDRPRPPAQSYRGASLPFELDVGLTAALKALGQEHGATLYMTLLAAFQTLLSRYTQQTEIAVGSPTANRRWAEAAGLVGYFVNPVVMRGDLSGDPTFEGFLGRVRQTVLDAFKHQDFPFPVLVERLHPSREASRSPLFQVQFILQKGHVRGEESVAAFAAGGAGVRVRLGALTLEPLPLEQRVAQFDLTLTAAEVEGRLAASFQYNTDLFDAATVERMAGHFETLLRAVTDRPASRVSRLPLLTDGERARLLGDLNATAARYAAPELLHQLIEGRAARTPGAVALSCEGEQVTYAELDARANRLARRLRRLGVGPEMMVGVCVERRVEMVVALLGVLKAGAAYVPIDPGYPRDRVAYVLEDSHTPVLLTQASLADSLGGRGARLVCLDSDWPEIERESAAAFDAGVGPDNLAYAIYTSGSTGRPKGVQISHRSIINFIAAMRELFPLSERDVLLSITYPSFDIAMLDLFLPLWAGAKVELVGRDVAVDPVALRRRLEESGADFLQATPSTWRMLVEAGWAGGSRLTMLCGGEAMTRELALQLLGRGGGELWNVYGPTETTVWSTARRVEAAHDRITVGRPIGNMRAYLLDGGMEPVPVGVAGELYIGGVGLSRGYLGRAALTAERFVPDPFSAEPGARFYRTGDLVRYLPDGQLEYLGRLDHQVKIRGFRIELGEIESVLAEHPSVGASVVLAKEDGRGQKRLVAYVLAAEPAAPSAAELRAYLKERLPDYMVPSSFVVLAEMPLTPNGKADRAALSKIDDAAQAAEGDYSAPRTVTEDLLAGIWAEILGVERVSVGDNFFELGGHSLLATQVVSRIRESFKIELPLREVFEHPTVAALADRVGACVRAGAGPHAPAVEPVERGGALPLSFGQQRLWFFDQLEPGSPLYNISGGVRLSGALDVRALERTLTEIVRRHEVLRTTFTVIGEEPSQLVHEPQPSSLPVTDLSPMDEAERELEAARLGREEGACPFDLARGPLVRASLLKLAADEHVLLVTMHHIVSDGWSVGVLINEIGALYEGFVKGEPAPLAALPVQYADYAVWQRNWLRGEVLESQLAYWRGQLAGASQVLELPTDRPRPPVQSNRGARVRFELSESLSERLRALSRREGVTLYMTLLAAFQTLLSRYTGQEDILVGADIANRHRGETEGLIGFFVNLLVMRGDLSGDPTFHELLARTREAALGAYAHQDVPFEKLVEEFNGGRDMSRAPLFQSLFVLQNTPAGVLELPGLKLTPFEVESDTAKFDLLLNVEEKDQRLEATLEYSTDLFDAATVRQMAAHFETLLAGAAESPESRLSALPWLTAGERERLLVGWNATATDYPRHGRIHELFAEQAARTPAACAVLFGDEAVTYGELNRRANRLANYLRSLGVGPEVMVGLCAERSVELVVGLLGILKAGAAYLPLDAQLPLDRLTFMLDDSQAPVLLTQEHLLDSLPAHWGQVVCLDSEWDLIEAGGGGDDPRVEVSPDNLAYAIYTSGSTGRPKGVQVSHRAVVRLVRETSYAEFGPDEVFLQLAPVSFDASTFEVWGALLNGARLVVMPPQPPSFEELGSALARYGVTTLWLTAGLFHLMVDERGADLGGLRQLLAGGDVLSPAHVRKYLEGGEGDRRLINGYGPTEGTTFTCCHVMTRAGDVGANVPIGRPISNTQVYVLDARMRPVPAGVAGDLYIGGDGLARGYLSRPALTAERFVPHPFSSEPGARLYQSGDRARFLADGRVEFLGRLDNQLKLRGFRIELGEIEVALTRHRTVREALVVAHADESGDKRLVAYLVPADPEEPPAAADLRRFLSGRLPEYMIPSFFVALDEFPLTVNGKVDRKLLPAPDAEQRSASDGEAAPLTPVEELLAAVWCEVLRSERVGVADDFFELGGHSLLATQVISRVRERFGVELALREVFEHPTVGTMARRIEAAMQSGGGEQAPPVRAVAREGRLALSFGQQRLWFFDQLEPGSPLYNISGGVRLSGALDVGALERTLTEIVRRHEVLRTTFTLIDGEPSQVIQEARPFELGVRDLGHLGADEGARAERAAAREESGRPFDLGQGPLLRATLLRFGQSEHVLLVTMHHIVSDGWSLGVLVREVAALYEAYAEGRESPLAELPVQYADYAVWQRNWLRGETLESQLDYWRRQLDGAPAALELTTDRPRPPVQTYRGAQEKVRLSDDLSEALRELSRREGVTLYMTLLAAWQTLLSRYTGQTDIVVGTPIANRQRGETEGLIGFFVNLLALRGDLSGDPTFRELLGRARETALGAYAHQEVPFDKLVEELDVKRDLSRSPLFQSLFVLQNAPMPPMELAGVVMSPLEGDAGMSHFDLTLDVAEEGGGLLCTLEYNSDLFDAATAARIVGQLMTLLAGSVADPQRRLSALPLLTEEEEWRQLFAWNETAAGYPTDPCLHQLFEAQAARTPAAEALVYEGERLSYAEVNRRADSIARSLVAAGAGPETLIGVLMERSAEAVVSLLGVLKAGAAYLPIDPTYPAERIGYMLSDAGAGLLLTQRRLAGGLAAHGARVLCVEDCEEGGAGLSAAARGVMPDHLAYVIYTSGSTGRPKGVMITHRAVVNHNFAVAARYELGPADRVLQFASLSFDVAVEEIFPTWLCGGCVVVRPDRALDSHLVFLELLERERVTVVNLSTPYWNEVVAEAGRAGVALTPTLRLAAVGGEKGLPEHFELSRQALAPGARLMNVYGPTETTVTNTAHDFGAEGCASPSVPIGRPIGNTRLYVLDRHLRPAPLGVAAELFIGGHSLARGYLNRPGLTAERFLPDPYSTEAGARMYRSGDLTRQLPTGEVEFVGRVDHQVKVRGFRVELGEVESALAQHPSVRQVLVMAREAAAGGGRLCAYVAPAAGESAAAAELRAYLKERLPDYMVPSFFVLMDEFPLTANGKVDRRRLPEPSEAVASATPYVAPRTAVEEMVCALLGGVLGVERMSLDDDFFEAGGHSLLATQVMSRVREAFGVGLPLRTLFEHPTAAALAWQIEAELVEGRATRAPAITRAPRSGALSLSFAQQRLWFFDQLEPGSTSYNVPVAVRLKGALDVPALERTLTEMVRRHEVLRTTFTDVEGEPRQVIHEAQPLNLPLTDLCDLAPAERTECAERLTREEAERPFDLSAGPLLRASLLRLAPEEHVCLLTMHHIVSDGWSMGVLVREVAALYEAYARGEESPLAELPVQYADYAAWQREYLQGEVLERQLSYWRRQLAGARQVLELPTDRPRPDVQSYRGATEEFGLGAELSERVRALGRERGCTLYMTLMAGFEILLSRYSGQEDMLVGTAIANRTRSETEGLIGFFVNTLVMRADLSREPTFAELMGRVRETALGAYAHQDVPFERLVEEVAPERRLSRTPLVQVAFGVFNEPERRLEIAGLEVSGAGTGIETGRFDLTLWMWEEQGGEIRGRWVYNTDLFEGDTVARMGRHLTRLLDGATAEPGARVGRLSMQTEEELGEQLEKKKKREASNVKKLKSTRRQAFTSVARPAESGPREGTTT